MCPPVASSSATARSYLPPMSATMWPMRSGSCDGQLLGKRELPKLEWLLTAGRNIAQLGFNTSHGNRVIMLTVTDIWSQKTLYQAELPVTARVSVIEPNLIAVFDPSGKFTLIDVEDGRLVIDQKLEAASDLQSIQTLKSGDELFSVHQRSGATAVQTDRAADRFSAGQRTGLRVQPENRQSRCGPGRR